jgi:hypothetical protein
MMPCPTDEELGAYHDGRLAGPVDDRRREWIQRHVLDCPACALQLSRLVGLSRLFSTAARPGLSQIARSRLHNRVDLAMERGLVRLGWSLSGIAASLLIVSSAWLMHVNSARHATEAAPPWIGVAASTDGDAASEDARTPAAAIYLADASVGSSNAEMP